MRSKFLTWSHRWLPACVGICGVLCLPGRVNAEPLASEQCRIRIEAASNFVEQQGGGPRISAPIIAAAFLKARELCRVGKAVEALAFCEDVIEILSHSSRDQGGGIYDP